jgi:hypothetical protein
LRAGAPRQLIFGEGELTHELWARALIDPKRFRQSRQVGNYFGLCPSESTSDQRRRMGAITKHGNSRRRRLMVEMAWRISRFQPNYRGHAAGERCSPIARSLRPQVRKPSSPWPVNSPSISGEWLPGECRPKNLDWSQEYGSTETHSLKEGSSLKKKDFW